MDREGIIEFLEILISSYKFANDSENPCNREIRMWRNRFLESYSPLYDHHIAAYFLALPSEEMLKSTPKEIYEKLIKQRFA